MKNQFSVGSIKQFIDLDGLKEEEQINRKQFVNDISMAEGEEKTFIAKISTSSVDADHEIVMPEGCDLTRFKKNPIIYWNHNYSIPPVAKALAIDIKDNCIVAKIKMADTALADEIWSLIKGSFIKCNSIGFIAKKSLIKGTKEFTEYIKDKALNISEGCNRIITEFLLIENSIVGLPSNQDALITAISSKSIELTDKTIQELDLPKVEVKVVEPKVEPKVEPVIEPPKVEPVIEPVVERVWNVIRIGGVPIDENLVKELVINKKLGKII